MDKWQGKAADEERASLLWENLWDLREFWSFLIIFKAEYSRDQGRIMIKKVYNGGATGLIRGNWKDNGSLGILCIDFDV